MLSMPLSSSLKSMSSANFSPIVVWNVPGASRFLNFSRSNLILDWVGFLVFFRLTQKVIITKRAKQTYTIMYGRAVFILHKTRQILRFSGGHKKSI